MTRRRLFRGLNSGDIRYRLPPVPAGTGIPRLIHQKCQSRADLPPELRRSVEALRGENPGWTHHLYDDEDAERFIAEHYPAEVLQLYNSISTHYGASRADLFRYLVIYALGGVYLDLKSGAMRPLDDIVRSDDRFLLAQWRNGPGEPHEDFGTWSDLADDMPGGEFQQWHVIAAPGHPFLKAVIEAVLSNIVIYDPWLHGTGRRGVLRLTGPIAYTRAIAPILSLHPHRRVASEADLSLVFSVIENALRVRTAKNHYTGRTDSVVVLRGPRAASARVYSGVKTVWRMYKERGHAAARPGPHSDGSRPD